MHVACTRRSSLSCGRNKEVFPSLSSHISTSYQGRVYVSVAAKGAWKYIKTFSFQQGLIGRLSPHALGDIVFRAAIALPSQYTVLVIDSRYSASPMSSAGSTRTESPCMPWMRSQSAVSNIFRSIHYQDNRIFDLVCHIVAAPCPPGAVKRLAVLVVGPAAKADETIRMKLTASRPFHWPGQSIFRYALRMPPSGFILQQRLSSLRRGNRVARSLALRRDSAHSMAI